MAKGDDTRAKIVAAAAKLFRRGGYNGAALAAILEAGQAPRGSLYFHFPEGKEEIGEAAIRLAGAAIRDAIATAAKTSDSAETFLLRIARGMAADLEASDFTEGCPIATTALETSSASDRLGAAARDAFASWEAAIAAGLVRFGYAPERAAGIAMDALAQLEGALLLARTRRDLAPMRRAENVLKLLLATSDP